MFGFRKFERGHSCSRRDAELRAAGAVVAWQKGVSSCEEPPLLGLVQRETKRKPTACWGFTILRQTQANQGLILGSPKVCNSGAILHWLVFSCIPTHPTRVVETNPDHAQPPSMCELVLYPKRRESSTYVLLVLSPYTSSCLPPDETPPQHGCPGVREVRMLVPPH